MKVATDVFGNPTRAAIFEYVNEHPGCYFGELLGDVAPTLTKPAEDGKPERKMTRQNFAGHLKVMVDAGVIVTDLPEEERNRPQRPKYFVDAERTDAVIQAWIEHVEKFRTRPAAGT
ncbi:ArsR family transcriptional regulator [Rathayibacter rathayi]|uniref:ArsR family transcriptional regulator n=1 Tax=Rathayibacter rathayi TaxID=33887 RepID=A0ABD6W6Y4_RATRA|nr:ArsR family transcriptional regulator [Rathayibacter rathayi]PPF42439.1 ArsR family transcriptional regulator [Rathayibacter rathayi]PPF74816.1 ArsR family transcriptional regulator [Rathayibacter rathayi]PPG09281.1 ArsR family transcriptional regulator [Rathayibacter rathayi]PPG36168.1 ArsR family transcriptional regulator [Rathayibacter rathayi]